MIKKTVFLLLVALQFAAVTPVAKADIESGRAMDTLPRDKDIVLYCKSGARSAHVVEVLTSAGFTRLGHLTGGILAWVHEIEPHKPVY